MRRCALRPKTEIGTRASASASGCALALRSIPRNLLVATYWRANLTVRQLGRLSGYPSRRRAPIIDDSGSCSLFSPAHTVRQGHRVHCRRPLVPARTTLSPSSRCTTDTSPPQWPTTLGCNSLSTYETCVAEEARLPKPVVMKTMEWSATGSTLRDAAQGTSDALSRCTIAKKWPD